MTTCDTLGEFVKILTAKLQSADVSLPFKDEASWHELFYKMSNTPAFQNSLPFLQEMFFEWTGPHPRSPELSDFLQALHWNACVSAHNPHYVTIELPESVQRLWLARTETLNHDVADALQQATDLASELFRIAD